MLFQLKTTKLLRIFDFQYGTMLTDYSYSWLPTRKMNENNYVIFPAENSNCITKFFINSKKLSSPSLQIGY